MEKKNIADIVSVESFDDKDEIMIYSNRLKKVVKIPFSQLLASNSQNGLITSALFQLLSPLSIFTNTSTKGLYEVHRQITNEHCLFMLNINYANLAGGTIIIDSTTHATVSMGSYSVYQIGKIEGPTLYVKAENSELQFFIDVPKEYWSITKRNLNIKRERTLFGLSNEDIATLTKINPIKLG